MAETKQKKPGANDDKKPFHVVVAEGLITQLEAGTAPWQRPWEAGHTGVLPMNPTTGKRYRGINSIQLMMQGRSDNRWLTYKQAEALGAQVRRGERGTLVQYWKFEEERNATDEQGRPVRGSDGEPQKERVRLERPKVFHAVVFNAEQIDGLPPAVNQPLRWDAVERAEAILKASGANIGHAAGDRAFYRPSTDSITMPYREQFKTADAYYATALHELGHWTGHESRLGRDLANPFGSEAYAKEELRAEIASMIVGDELGIGHDPGQHAAYVKSWVKVLKDDPMEILRAAADAEKIHGYVMAFEQKQVQGQGQSQQQQPAHPPAFIDTNGLLREWNSADMLPTDWRGIAKTASDDFLLFGEKDGNRAVTPLKAKTYREALQEADSFRMNDSNQKNQEDNMQSTSRITTPLADETSANRDAGFIDRVVGFVDEVVAEAKVTGGALKDLWDANPGFSGDPDEFFSKSVAESEEREIAEKEERKASEYRAMRQDRVERAADWTEEQASEQAKADARAYTEQNDPTERRFMLDDMALHAASNDHYRRALESVAPEVLKPQKNDQVQSQPRFIDVPFKQKDEAKKLGAKWDRAKQSWYVPPGVNQEPFERWIPNSAENGAMAPAAAQSTESNTKVATTKENAPTGRFYLAVPYTDRMDAKAAGAAWDKAAKSWYAGPNADMAKLERWNPENVKAQQDPAMTPREEFAEALRSMQCVVEGEHPIMDGQRHRIKVVGDAGKEKAGFYVCHSDGHPAGYIKNNRSGEEMRWKSTGYSMSDEDKAKMRAEAADKLAERAAMQERAQAATAERLAKQLDSLVHADEPTAYMQAKGIASHSGALTDSAGQKTYIPAMDADGKVWTMQYIQEDGTKRFAKDSRKEGCFHPVGGIEGLATAPVLVIAEGYATAATLAEALGHSTVAAFDSGNLKAVAVALHAKYPEKPVVIAGDDDRHLPMMVGNNPGREKAIEAAAAVGGRAVFPVFAPGEAEWPKGVPTITPDAYKSHQAAMTALEAGGQTPEQAAALKAELLSQEQLDALANLKRHTDFNDLATRSALGRDGLVRQASSATSMAMEQKNEHEQTRAQDEPQEQQRPRRAAKIG